jgi:hypothetical protein
VSGPSDRIQVTVSLHTDADRNVIPPEKSDT